MHVRSEMSGQTNVQRGSRPGPERAESPSLTGLVAQGKAGPEMVTDLQRTAGNAAVVQLLADDNGAGPQEGTTETASLLAEAVAKPGQPLEDGVRTGMENALGTDLGSVRVHTGGEAAASAQALQAQAYTVGENIVFGAGQYQPGSPSGQRVLAHELTHVVQQRTGPVDGSDMGGGLAVSHPSDRFEKAAESNAALITSGLTSEEATA